MTKRLPDFITFTGIDERTPIDEVAALSRLYPIEWGVLLSHSQQGRSRRFPAVTMLRELLILARIKTVKVAAHLCGGAAAMALGKGSEVYPVPLVQFGRVQINHYTAPDVQAATSFAMRWGLPTILQLHEPPFPKQVPTRNISFLFDPSAGAGAEPAQWPRHPDGITLSGYAGGIGPHNVVQALEEIDSDGPYWIDMETHVRTDEWLDLEKCRKVCEMVYGQRTGAR